MRTIRPLKDHVLIRQDPPKEKLGTLFVPQGTRDLFEDIGTVIATGPGTTTVDGVILPVSVKPGDRVAFKRRPGSALSGEWDGLLMLKDEDIVGVLDTPSVTVDAHPTGSVVQGDRADHTLPEERR